MSQVRGGERVKVDVCVRLPLSVTAGVHCENAVTACYCLVTVTLLLGLCVCACVHLDKDT